MKLLRHFLFLLCMAFPLVLCAQEDDESDVKKEESDGFAPRKIDSTMALSPDYMPVSYACFSPHWLIPFQYKPVDTSMAKTHQYNPLHRNENITQNLGFLGQAHQFMNYDYHYDMGFSMITLPYPLYMKTQDQIKVYDLKTSYTDLAFTFGIANEYDFTATHAQKVKGVTLAFNMYAFSNEGYFLNQLDRNINVDFMLHYEIPSQIYGFTVSYIFDRLKMGDNGGLVNSQAFKAHLADDLMGYKVKSAYGKSMIRTHDVAFQQYVNIITKNKKYFGSITHTFEFRQLRTDYFDERFDSTFYQPHYLISPDTTFDTVQYYSIRNTVQWSNYKPFDTLPGKKYFLRVSGGLMHEYVNAVCPNYEGNTFYLFARAQIRFFGALDVYGRISYAFGGYNKNDAFAEAGLKWQIQKKYDHYLGLKLDYYHNSPDFIYQTYYGNHNYWMNQDWAKQNVVKVGAVWSMLNYQLEFNYYMLHNLVRLNSEYKPFVSEKAANLMQVHLFAPIRVKGFGFDINAYVQYCKSDVLNVPVFAIKASPYYIFNLIRNKLKLQIGCDLMYNTSYNADGYDPVLHQFYYQNEEKVGNYAYLDANITLKVKRIAFFFRAGHFLSGLIGYNYFYTPDYPALDRRFQVGLTWKFYD